MAMTIRNNSGTTKSLGELNKNINAMGRILAQSASGMKINSAADDASGMSISEKMRTQLRSLEQDVQNVRTGKNLINTAAGGIDEIIQELRNLKALAINAANDHNSDLDRATLQKEFDQRMENINDIASTTNYNGKLLLNGDYERYRKAWIAEYEGNGNIEPPELPDYIDVIEPNDPPTEINQEHYIINVAGVYIIPEGYSGTIDIADGLVGVKIKQASAAQLSNVFIKGPSGGNANLWIENININNNNNESWINFSGNDNVLSIKGDNSFTNNGSMSKAGINIGGGLTIQGTGKLEMNITFSWGAIIGTNRNENSNANLTINSGTYVLTAADSRENTVSGGGSGACIGSGGNSKMGDIVINGGNFDLYHTGGGSCIGSGEGRIGSVGDLTIKNAKIVAVADDGACIGSGYDGARLKNILIEDSDINVEARKTYAGNGSSPINDGDGAGIGSGGLNSDVGSIIVRNSKVNASSVWGAGIGTGYSAKAGDITIENLTGNITSVEGEAVGRGLNGTISKVNDDGGGRDPIYREEMILGTPLVIHNGTKSNQALRCFIPNMHTKNMGLENISITTQQSAQHLLGDPHNPDVPGILDKAIDYALDAATGMGSYIIELNASEDNLVTNSENTQASESTIRDADMAKTALEYAKYSVLSQASQSMLAQANQTSSQVLSLLGM